MATSNFLPFNPTQANQETDAAYLTDATRTGGAGVGAIWPSNSANKTLYQVSTAVAALMQAMANKGFTVSDASLSALTTQLANILTTADLLSNLQSVSWAYSLALNAARYNGFEISLAGNSTLSISGQTVGQVIVLLFAQDGTGGHTITYPGNIVGGAQPDPSVSIISGQIFKVNAVGTLQALGPMVSSNGMSGTAIGSVNPAAGAFSALTGPTVSSSDNSTKVATTAWNRLGFSVSLSTNGYIKFPTWLSGFTIQWGSQSGLSDNSPDTINFNTPFANTCFAVLANDNGFHATGGNPRTIGTTVINNTQFTLEANGSGAGAFWIAVGY